MSKKLKIIIFLFFISFEAYSRHIVFDLDWTLFYISSQESFQIDQKDVFQYNGTYYRLAPGAIDLLNTLTELGFQISFFSGGDYQRNQYLIHQVRLLARNQNKNINIYKTLHFHHLTSKSDLPGLRFTQRWSKDLKKIHSDLSQIILVDDIAQFSMPEQQSNLMHLDRTYNDFPNYTSRASTNDPEFDPPNLIEWYKERNKLYAVLDRLLALDSKRSVQDQLPQLMKREVCRFIFLSHD